jgi:hypothetical protein
MIVSANSKDFTKAYLKTFDIVLQEPDEFISNLLSLNKPKVLEALNNQIKSLKNPPKTKTEVLNALEKCGLKKSIALLP